MATATGHGRVGTTKEGSRSPHPCVWQWGGGLEKVLEASPKDLQWGLLQRRFQKLVLCVAPLCVCVLGSTIEGSGS